MQRLERPSIEFYLGAAITILSAVVPMTWWLRCIFLLIVAGIWIDLVWRSPLTTEWRLRRKIPVLAIGVAMLAATSWRAVRDDYRGAKLPDVSLSFAFPASPTLMLKNQSDMVARNVKWAVLLWNLDNATIYSQPISPELADKHEPLPIPVGNFDFLRAGITGGPLNLFDSTLVKPHIKAGDRLFGSASVMCPDCERGHTFVVSIVFGQGGWYAEIPEETSGNPMIPRRLLKNVVRTYVDELTAKAPEKNRIPIVDAF